jgi:hypothetical protein
MKNNEGRSMTRFRAPKLAILTGLALLSSSAAALADPPDRVGRLSDIEGVVSFHTADQTDWSPATLNYPVTGGTSFWTEPNARDEIQIGAAEVRMDQSTALTFTQLDDAATQIEVDQGVVNVHVGVLPPGGISIVTPQGQVDLLAPGSYDIDAGPPAPQGQPPAPVRVTALEGSARIDGPRGAIDVQAGETGTMVANPFSVNLAEGNPTPFDDWALAREHREEAAGATQQYVPPDMTGYQDLNANGQWASTPDYGQVWYPTAVPVGWAPYRFGHWAFVPPWGWTWIDDAPWGFAPFHYGRWAFVGGRWGWCPVIPGAIVARPVYAPALVAFVGGGGFGVSLSIGGPMAAVGWVPLAPFEPYHPWYRVSPRYERNVNVFNVRRKEINNITVVNNNMTVDHFANHQAAVVVTANAFTHAAPVQHATVAVPHEQLAQVRVAANLSAFKATPEARAGFARPNAVGVQRADISASVAHDPVPYRQQTPGPAATPTPRAPGPQIQPRTNVAPGQPRPMTQPVQQAQPRPAMPSAQQSQPRPMAPAQQANPVRPPPAVAGQPPRPSPQAAQLHPVPRPAPRPPAIAVQHPVQQTHLAATPQGWRRQPAPPAQQHAAPAPAAGDKEREKH